MLCPQLSILRNFEPRASLLPLGDRVWLIEQGIVRSLTWTAEGQVTTIGLWGQGDIVGLLLTRLSPYQMECYTLAQQSGTTGAAGAMRSHGIHPHLPNSSSVAAAKL